MSEAAVALRKRLKEIGGCTDGYCRVIPQRGMHTNGGCRCFHHDKYKAERVVAAYQAYFEAVEGERP